MGWGSIKKTLFGGSEVRKMDTMTGGQKALLGQSAGLSQQYNPTAYKALGEIAGQGLTEDLFSTRYADPMRRQFELMQRETNQQLAGKGGFHTKALAASRFDNMLTMNTQLGSLRGSVEQMYSSQRMQAALGLGQMAQGTMGQKPYESVVTSDSGLFGALAQIGVTAAAGKSMFAG